METSAATRNQAMARSSPAVSASLKRRLTRGLRSGRSKERSRRKSRIAWRAQGRGSLSHFSAKAPTFLGEFRISSSARNRRSPEAKYSSRRRSDPSAATGSIKFVPGRGGQELVVRAGGGPGEQQVA